MSTWEIMLGIEAISAGISLSAILYFMFQNEEEEAVAFDFDSMNNAMHA